MWRLGAALGIPPEGREPLEEEDTGSRFGSKNPQTDGNTDCNRLPVFRANWRPRETFQNLRGGWGEPPPLWYLSRYRAQGLVERSDGFSLYLPLFYTTLNILSSHL